MKNLFFILFFLITVGIFFMPIFFGKIPIPADTIIGLYHPYRDLYSKEYPQGIPYKNYLITDPVRQQYPWKILTVLAEKKLQLPLWNPYNFSGTPHLGNFQSAAFYPLNVFYFFVPFSSAWTLLIVFQPILAGIFMYLYLDYFKLKKIASLLGAITWVFSGFFVSWLEWNTIIQTALWLPLLLLAKEHLLVKFSKKWILVFLLAECSAIFAGHLQVYFYFFLVSNIYLFARIFQILQRQIKQNLFVHIVKTYTPFLVLGATVLLITSIQWMPTLQFILLSARASDQTNWQTDGWFIPWQHLVQFIAPDFFGNPTTLNYSGVWNYGELVGYIGIIPLLFCIYALFSRRDKKTFFFGSLIILSLIFSLPTFIAKIPYILKIPFISSSQPTRLVFIIDFSLAILAALGLDYFIRKRKNITSPIIVLGFIFIGIWLYIAVPIFHPDIQNQYIDVAKHNLYFPTLMFLISILPLIFLSYRFKKNNNLFTILICILVGLTTFDLLRFANKFTPFTKSEYLFPNTKVLSFLKSQPGQFRITSLDLRILPPNFSIMYKLQSIEGYDPLYLQRYGELIAASERGKPDISPPFGFNRIITPHNYNSKIIDLLGVKYILSLTEISSPKLKKVFQEGQTRVYENSAVLPRTFFVQDILPVEDRNAIEKIFSEDLTKTAIVENPEKFYSLSLIVTRKPEILYKGEAFIESYEENRIVIHTKNTGAGFLVLTDSYYSPLWHVKVDNRQTSIYRTDYNFRGIFVPKGNHKIEFYASLL